MPVTSFENSAMKSSFSLSSLPIAKTPEKNATKTREFNSLKKKRKEPTKRLSWGSTASEQKDDFWSKLEANYNYIMDNQLIDNCQDANCELSADSRTWSMKEFNAQFSELYSWLNRIQEKIYGHEDNVTNKTIRTHCKTKIIKKRPFYNIFNEQGLHLMNLHPELNEDISWRVSHLNSKWDTLEAVLKSSDSEQSDTIDIQREVKCLKNWIRQMESRLQPLSFQKRWAKGDIEPKAVEHKVLHKDIENHGKIVNSVVKLCKRTTENFRTTLNVVNGLERRYHLLFLRSMEWQCYIENLVKRLQNSVSFSDSDSDEGPVKKQPRLSAGSPDMKDVSCVENALDEIDGKLDENKENDNMNPQGTETDYSKTAVVSEEDAQFTKSNRNAPNLGTYYFKHVDTDSDMEKIEKLQNITLEPEMQTQSDTSEEEWVYTANKDHLLKSPVQTNNLHRIFQEVEELISPIKRIHPTVEPAMNKMLRIKQWLKIDKPDDSCDASSEDEENESESSEELNESIATYRPQTSLNASYIDLDIADSTPKVTMRQRYNSRGMKGQRPSSIACITQLSKHRIDHGTQPYSISESALHKLSLTANMNTTITNQNQGNNSTSSTVEDSCALNEEHNSPLRKKRLKLKKKSNIFRKMEMSVPYGGAMRDRVSLVKSGSFSGRPCIPSTCERHTVSDPSAINIGPGFETSTTSGADSDDDKRGRKMPLKLGAKLPYGLDEVRDDSPGKFSLNTNEEQSSSLCDEAWDGYQEKYSSEAYSEAHDSDAARRLWEFGEDYRTFLGSQSDTQSSQLEFSPQFPRKATLRMNVIDSDSEGNDLRQLLKDSGKQFDFSEKMYIKQHALGLNQFLVNNDLTDLIGTCDRHTNCLSPIEKSSEKCKLLPVDKKELSDLKTRWLNLKGRVAKMQEYRDLQNELGTMKRKLCLINIPGPIDALIVSTIEDLSRDIDFYSAELATIDEHKEKLLKVNVAVNHFMAENVEYSTSSLKSDLSELYRIWNEKKDSAIEGVNFLNVLLQRWQIMETRLDQLRGDLREDEQTLGVLDMALQGGTFSNQMASSVRGVAKLLSESKTEGCSFPEIFLEGSFSDSGISDEGSEHDLGERERRLLAIRRLGRQLEQVMAPDCMARVRMKERLAAAEEELRSLQNKCRSIIVRTAVSAAAPLSESVVAAGPGGDPGEEPNTKSWFKRVVRASFSFQVAITVALLFVACFFEPHCCDNINNLQLSMNPQLHYVRGPPPI